jgi:hypothetical protein
MFGKSSKGIFSQGRSLLSAQEEATAGIISTTLLEKIGTSPLGPDAHKPAAAAQEAKYIPPDKSKQKKFTSPQMPPVDANVMQMI